MMASVSLCATIYILVLLLYLALSDLKEQTRPVTSCPGLSVRLLLVQRSTLFSTVLTTDHPHTLPTSAISTLHSIDCKFVHNCFSTTYSCSSSIDDMFTVINYTLLHTAQHFSSQWSSLIFILNQQHCRLYTVNTFFVCLG